MPVERAQLRALATLVALIAALAAGACGGSSSADEEERVAPVRTSDPAVAFAPLVHLHSAERWFPVSAKEFIDQSMLSWAVENCSDAKLAIGGPRRRLRRDPQEVPTIDPELLGHPPGYRHRPLDSTCFERRPQSYSTVEHTRPYDADRPAGLPASDGFYLDLLSDRHGGRPPERRGGQRAMRDVPVYVERQSERVGRRPGLRLTYWMLFADTVPPGLSYDVANLFAHEGDWERVSVLLRRDGERRYQPISMRFHVHGRGRDVPWAELERVSAPAGRQASHPVVYAARGTHAPYPDAGTARPRLRAAGRAYAIYDLRAEPCADCPRWPTWDLVLDAPAQGWYGYGGAWGQVFEGPGTSGSLGPSPYVPGGAAAPRPPDADQRFRAARAAAYRRYLPDRRRALRLLARAQAAFRAGDADGVCATISHEIREGFRPGGCARTVAELSRAVRGGRRHLPQPNVEWVQIDGGVGQIAIGEDADSRITVSLVKERAGWKAYISPREYPEALIARIPAGVVPPVARGAGRAKEAKARAAGRARDGVAWIRAAYLEIKADFDAGRAQAVCDRMTAVSTRASLQGEGARSTCRETVAGWIAKVASGKAGPRPRVKWVRDYGDVAHMTLTAGDGSDDYFVEFIREDGRWLADPEFKLHPRSLDASWPEDVGERR
jgi:hypothetical protein